MDHPRPGKCQLNGDHPAQVVAHNVNLMHSQVIQQHAGVGGVIRDVQPPSPLRDDVAAKTAPPVSDQPVAGQRGFFEHRPQGVTDQGPVDEQDGLAVAPLLVLQPASFGPDSIHPAKPK